MALAPSDGEAPAGPSASVRAWADWVIDVRRPWHQGDPPPKPGWRLLAGAGGWLLALAAIVEKIVAG